MPYLRKNTRFRVTTTASKEANRRLRDWLFGEDTDNPLKAIYANLRQRDPAKAFLLRYRWSPLMPYWFRDLSLKIRDNDLWLLRPGYQKKLNQITTDATQDALMQHSQAAFEDILRAYFSGEEYK